MSDPVLVIDLLSPPSLIPEACSQPPPAPPVADACSVKVPLGEKGVEGPSRYVRMDRRGSAFVVSPRNTIKNLAWMLRFQNRPDVAAYLRPMLNSEFLRVPDSRPTGGIDLPSRFAAVAGALLTLGIGPEGAVPGLALYGLLKISRLGLSSPR